MSFCGFSLPEEGMEVGSNNCVIATGYNGEFVNDLKFEKSFFFKKISSVETNLENSKFLTTSSLIILYLN